MILVLDGEFTCLPLTAFCWICIREPFVDLNHGVAHFSFERIGFVPYSIDLVPNRYLLLLDIHHDF